MAKLETTARKALRELLEKLKDVIPKQADETDEIYFTKISGLPLSEQNKFKDLDAAAQKAAEANLKEFNDKWQNIKKEEEQNATITAAMEICKSFPEAVTVQYYTGDEAKNAMQAKNPAWLEHNAALAPGQEQKGPGRAPEYMAILDKDGKELISYEVRADGSSIINVDPDNVKSLQKGFELAQKLDWKEISTESPEKFFGKNPETALQRFKNVNSALDECNKNQPNKSPLKFNWPEDKAIEDIFGKDKEKCDAAKKIKNEYIEAHKKLYEKPEAKPDGDEKRQLDQKKTEPTNSPTSK